MVIVTPNWRQHFSRIIRETEKRIKERERK
jgi:hypothetical protein